MPCVDRDAVVESSTCSEVSDTETGRPERLGESERPVELVGGHEVPDVKMHVTNSGTDRHECFDVGVREQGKGCVDVERVAPLPSTRVASTEFSVRTSSFRRSGVSSVISTVMPSGSLR